MSSDRPSGDRSLTWWPIAGAAIIAAIGVAVIVFVGSGTANRDGLVTDDNGALTCVGSYLHPNFVNSMKAWVPVPPTSVDGSDSLVPDAKPEQVTICHYRAGTTEKAAKLPLLGRTTLKSGQRAMATALSKYPAAPKSGSCTPVHEDPYLVGFVFGGGAVWVSLPVDGCGPTTNGDFRADADIRAQVIAAYQTRKWA